MNSVKRMTILIIISVFFSTNIFCGKKIKRKRKKSLIGSCIDCINDVFVVQPKKRNRERRSLRGCNLVHSASIDDKEFSQHRVCVEQFRAHSILTGSFAGQSAKPVAYSRKPYEGLNFVLRAFYEGKSIDAYFDLSQLGSQKFLNDMAEAVAMLKPIAQYYEKKKLYPKKIKEISSVLDSIDRFLG